METILHTGQRLQLSGIAPLPIVEDLFMTPLKAPGSFARAAMY